MHQTHLAFILLGSLLWLFSIADAHGETAAIPLGQLRPTGLPEGIPFGGGGNSFERRVDVSGSLAVVGAGLFRQGAAQGHAFVFDLSDPANPRQIAMLRPSDNSAGNEFGDGVAISGNYVFVGAWGDSEERGAVYMYDVSDPNHVVERKITAFDAAHDNSFGFSLSVDGTRLIVGAPKFAQSPLPPAAYIVDFSDPDNIQQTKVIPNPLVDSGYGLSVDISGDIAIVGQPSLGSPHPFAGAAYLYDLNDPSSIRSKRLMPTDAPNYESFGGRVSIDGTKALVSVTSDPGATNNAGNLDGAVWAFSFSDWDHVLQSEYGRPVPGLGGGPIPPFGRFLDLQGDLAFAGAFNESIDAGAIYLHDISNVLAPKELLRIPAPAGSQRFGISFAVDGSYLLSSDQEGATLLYRLVPEPSCAALIGLCLALNLVVRRRYPVNWAGVV